MTEETDKEKIRDDRGGERSLLARLRQILRVRNGSHNLRDTIEEMIELEKEVEGRDNAEELSLLRNILNVRYATVDDVMVPRADIKAVEAKTTITEVKTIMSEEGHSRLPVYREKLDDVVGMVHIKDLLVFRADDTATGIGKIVRKTLFVAPSMPVLELLLQMRVQRTHMALVVDEFGGIDGLVTIEDLVEEIVGEIEDEHDKETRPRMIKKGLGLVDVDARLSIDEFEEEVGSFLSDNDREEDIDTMGGLVFYLAGRVPGRGEVIVHNSGMEFEVLDADPRRIRRLRVSTPPIKNKH